MEAFDVNQVANKILELCKESESGIQHDQLSRLVNIPEDKCVLIINQLIKGKHIKAKLGPENQPVYSYQDPEEEKRFSGLERDDLAIYQLIKNSHTNGMTINEIKTKSQMNQTQLKNILKTLQKRNLIKTEKSINQKNRNVYLLFELEPSAAVKGNIFYSKGELDKVLVEGLYDKIYQYVDISAKKQGSVTRKEIAVYLRGTEFAEKDLQDDDIQAMLNVLIYDEKIEEIEPQRYCVCKWDDAIEPSVLTLTPCGTCPVFNECREGGVISPEKCIYFLDW